MKNLRNIFKEYNDPKVFREMKISFACMIVLGVLIALLASPDLRRHVGIGDAEPLTNPPHAQTIGNAKVTLPGRGGDNQAYRAHAGDPKSVSQPSQGHSPNNPSKHHSEPKTPSGNGNPDTPPQAPPGSPPSQEPTPTAPSNPGTPTSLPEAPNGSSGESQSGGGGGANSGGKVTVEVPDLEVPPLVEEATEDANGAVNDVTGTVGQTTQEAPVHVEPPEVCVLKC